MDWPTIARVLWSGARLVHDVAQSLRPDHIIACWALPCGYWAHAASVRLGIPFSVWCLGSDIWATRKVPLVRSVLRRTLRAAKFRFADGYALSADVRRLSRKSCQFLPSSRQLELHPKPSKIGGKRRLVFVGRWHCNKGVDLLLDSLSHLTEEDWRLIECISIYGGGPLEDEVENRISEYQKQGRPVFSYGYISKSTAAAVISEADFVLIPSRTESIPVIFSDAMQCRTPVIATPVGDIPRLLREHKVGLVAKEVHPRAFAAALQYALANSPQQFQNELSKAAKQFDLQQACKTLLDKLRSRELD